MKNYTEIIVGIMSILIVLYRVKNIMFPMITQGIKEKDISKVLVSFTQMV